MCVIRGTVFLTTLLDSNTFSMHSRPSNSLYDFINLSFFQGFFFSIFPNKLLENYERVMLASFQYFIMIHQLSYIKELALYSIAMNEMNQ
jgi:hypothetical protein